MKRAGAAFFAVMAAGLAACRAPAAAPPGPAVIRVDRATTYQTITGWEATAEAGQHDEINGGVSTLFLKYKDRLFDLAVSDLGLNRLRLEVRSGAENPRDYFAEFFEKRISVAEWHRRRYEIVNDNRDPNVIAWTGFHFTELDLVVRQIVEPIRERVNARGERLHVLLNYVDFGRSRFEHYDNPEEYAEFIEAAFLHLRDTFGWTPDGVELVLEPDNTPWDGHRLGRALVATAQRLRRHGFHPCFTAPSTTAMVNAPMYFDGLASVSGAAGLLRELSYHRYRGSSEATLRTIAERAARYRLDTAMLEHIGSGYEDLHEDLTVANVSAWQQFALAFPAEDNGAQYYVIDQTNRDAPGVHAGQRTWFLRQYFKYVRSGARRVAATSTSELFAPVAFVNHGGGLVLVVKAARAGAFTVDGLTEGRYGISYSTDTERGAERPDVAVAAGHPLSTSIPARGVLTIHGRAGSPEVRPPRAACR